MLSCCFVIKKKDFSIDLKNYIIIYSNHSDLFRLKFHFFQIWITSLYDFFAILKWLPYFFYIICIYLILFWQKSVTISKRTFFNDSDSWMCCQKKVCLGHMDLNFWQLTENGVLQLSQVHALWSLYESFEIPDFF